MRSARRLSTILLLLFLTFVSAVIARADDDEAEEYDVKARVVRISLITGEASLKRSGNTDWERARLNFPLVEGDTLSTERASRLELQIDARNFVRIGSETVVRIVALRDEGVALSVIEGTAAVRLAKFDRTKEYFEIDAPNTTMAAEKTGLYRVDVGREGRVRITVRDGGNARIYSDTSGFALRDGRSAELVGAGDNAGDWNLLAAEANDVFDDWINDRERFLAQRLRYDVQYYDQYVWGAEDLDAYGDWSFTTDYGWVWQPRASAIKAYADWAPYRHGYWSWCDPYGWTWVGSEPWGWAPYHYGRWVFVNGHWVWCPRSQYYRNRSWWRPALVAVVYVDYNRGYCWYPLGYHQRDPHSRRYNPGRGHSWHRDDIASRPRHPHHPQGVTWVPAGRIGSDTLRPRRADDGIARRIRDWDPSRTGFGVRPPHIPNRAGTDQLGNGPAARPDRVNPRIPWPGRRTGAGVRIPGRPLDDELRRTRILHGRDPRPRTGNEGAPTNADGTQNRPTGAVTRPPRGGSDAAPGGNSAGDRPRNPGARPPGGWPGNSGRNPDGTRRPDAPTVTPPATGTTEPATSPTTEDVPERSPGESSKPMRGQSSIQPVPRSEGVETNRPGRGPGGGGRPAAPTVTPPATGESGPATRPRPPREDMPPERSPGERSKPMRGQSSIQPVPRSEGNEAARPERPQTNEPPRVETPPRSEAPAEPRERPSRPSRPDNPEPAPQPTELRVEPPPQSEPRVEPQQRNEPRNDPRDEPRERPSRPSRSNNNDAPPPRPEPRVEPPQQSEPRAEPPPRSEPRNEPREAPSRPSRQENYEPPAQRSEPRVESRPEPRPEPPQRSEPPPRSEPPQRSEPPPRSDPPPRAEPPPRSDPPPRTESPRPESQPDRPRKPDNPDRPR